MTIAIKPNWKLAIGLPVLVFLACFLITLSAKFATYQAVLSNAIIIDILFTAPLLYFLVIRKSSVSKLTVVRVFMVGLFVAGWILNTESNTALHIIKIWISPAIECVAIYYVARKFYIANKTAKQSQNNTVDFLMHCRAILFEVTGNEKAGNIISSEIAVLYYAIFGRKDKNIDYRLKFSSYKENGILLILGTFLCLFLIETISVHLVLNLFSKTMAWIITGLSFYTCIQLYAHIKAIQARPVTLGMQALDIHNGLAGDACIHYTNIDRIEYTDKIPAGGEVVKIALLKGLEKHNCIIYLKQPILTTKIFGIKKTADTILFNVDRIKYFTVALNAKLTQQTI